MKQQRGSIALNISLVIMLVVIGVLAYILMTGKDDKDDKTFAIQSPDTENTSPAAGDDQAFSDGLGQPGETIHPNVNEYGEGVSEIAVFYRDINADGHRDRITRRHIENATSHFYYEYKIELNTGTGEYLDITPPDFRTVTGTECALTLIQFRFMPEFHVVMISRPWRNSWTSPTQAMKTTYVINNSRLEISDASAGKTVCDVRDLF